MLLPLEETKLPHDRSSLSSRVPEEKPKLQTGLVFTAAEEKAIVRKLGTDLSTHQSRLWTWNVRGLFHYFSLDYRILPVVLMLYVWNGVEYGKTDCQTEAYY